jgi:hypothetical protein
MPKTNHSGATSYGDRGAIVEDANGKKSRLDPSVNVDGTTAAGFESEDRDLAAPGEVNDPTQLQAVDAPVHQGEDERRGQHERDEQDEQDGVRPEDRERADHEHDVQQQQQGETKTKGVSKSAGFSSATSSKSTGSTPKRTGHIE